MSNYDEQYRLHHFHSGELPSGLYSELIFECANGNNCVAKVISVMELIVKYNREEWLDDEHWHEILPQWLLETFKNYTSAELSKILSDRSSWNNLAWTFGSWLDRMRDRDWEWWSLNDEDGKITVYLAVSGYPSSTKVLEHLIVAAGGRFL